ncbi:phosphoenolpyruvate--protein phosphotransferase [Vallitalea okinawensis]|uniref:phosphoenolpyruvate--protein phosphotransferase n=1 Tax=Vallitalea okinawensis TaxID=2078660 RepID=UPI001FA83F83|nr:phosphoenolpyruvate--protein phosphotransferase [Vallitalea okinawensis]
MKIINGIGASEGIQIGKIYKYEVTELSIIKKDIIDIDKELAKLEVSLDKSMNEIEVIRCNTLENMGEDAAAIFSAHLEILKDPELIDGIKNLIVADKVNAEYAVDTITKQFLSIFEAMDNEYIRERAADIKDVAKRMIEHILGVQSQGLDSLFEPVIILAKDLTPSDTASLNKHYVMGFITEIGGRTSHSAIMARTMQIPAVTGASNVYEELETGDRVILNGITGEIILHPTEDAIHSYKERVQQFIEDKKKLQEFKNFKSKTRDGISFDIAANIGCPEDIDQVLEVGADGIGLFRTEFLYMGREKFPTEEEQFSAYKTVLEKMEQRPVVIRTLDIGGDKELDYYQMPKELNPFLGNRAIRLCLNEPEIFKVQIRALLRASVYGNLHIMLPMIATIDEFRSVRNEIHKIEKELISEGVQVNPEYKLGIMIEIPSAALSASVFAKEVDFFSIGTNDLIQYTFAADRMNEKVSYLYQPFHPSLLRLVNMVVDAAHKEKKWVGMCGEMGGDTKALPLLLGLELDEISMSAPTVLKVRSLASKISKIDAKVLLEESLMKENQEQVLELVEDFLTNIED